MALGNGLGVSRERPAGSSWRRSTVYVLSACVVVVLLFGCSDSEVVTPRASAPAQIYSGPAYLRGTIGSLTRLRGARPLLVSGYGLVVGLKGTGSADVPAFLKVWLINEMRKKGVGSARYGFGETTPERLLASMDTAVVLVQGLIPPGAVKGARYDVRVSALPQTQTTSLAGGRLWTTDLAGGGKDPSLLYRHKAGAASGPVYVVAADPDAPDDDMSWRREGVVLSGGRATTNQRLELILNQPSWQRSRAISDRINERLPKGPDDRFDTAVPATDVVIRLNVPGRFGRQPDAFLALMSRLYLQRSADFEPEQAQRLADLVVAQPELADDIVVAWHGLGKTALPVLRNYYAHQQIETRLAALDAGARLDDEMATDGLEHVVNLEEPDHRRRAAEILAHLPDSIRGARALHHLLNDPDRSVRLEAYESLATMNDPIIRRYPIADQEGFKFLLDVVPSRRGLVYITQLRAPRLVVFGQGLGFRTPFLARLWGNRLMLRCDGDGGPLTVFYQNGTDKSGRTFEIPARVVDLVTLMARRPTVAAPEDGLDLSYGQVASVVKYLCEQGHIEADVRVQPSPLARMIERAQENSSTEPRPETGGGGAL